MKFHNVFLNGHQVLFEDDDAPDKWIAKNAAADFVATGIQIRCSPNHWDGWPANSAYFPLV